MNNRKDILKELKKIAPELNELPDNDGFKLPENYFTKMQSEVLERIEQTEPATKSEGFFTGIWQKTFKPLMAFASVLVLAGLSVGYFLYQQHDVEENCQQISCLTYSEIDAYVTENLVNFNEIEFASELNLNTENPSWNFDDDMLEEYLLENSEDFDLENLL